MGDNHQDLAVILKNLHVSEAGSNYGNSRVDMDFSRIFWEHYAAELKKFKVASVAPIPKAIKAGEVSATEFAIFSFDMQHGFILDTEDFLSNVVLTLPCELQRAIPGVPAQIEFPHAGKSEIKYKNERPLPEAVKAGRNRIQLNFEETDYIAKVYVQTSFTGNAIFIMGHDRHKQGYKVKRAISANSNKSDQCTSDGDFISIGSLNISVRKYIGCTKR